MGSKKVRVALIGSGRAGMIHARNLHTVVANACVVAVCDPVEEAARAAAAELELARHYGSTTRLYLYCGRTVFHDRRLSSDASGEYR